MSQRHRRHARLALAIVAATIVALGACTSTDTSKPIGATRPTPSRGVAPSPSDPVAAAALDAFQRFTAGYVKAYDTGNYKSGDFIKYGAGSGAGLQFIVGFEVQSGAIGTGAPSWRDVSVKASTNGVAFTACFDPGTWQLVNKKSGALVKPISYLPVRDVPHPAFLGDKPHAYQTTGTMYFADTGVWVVSQISAHRNVPC